MAERRLDRLSIVGRYADVTAPALYGRDINYAGTCGTCRTWPR